MGSSEMKSMRLEIVSLRSRDAPCPISAPIALSYTYNSDPRGYTCMKVPHSNCAESAMTKGGNGGSNRCMWADSGNSYV